MNERELKSKANALRHEIDARKKGLYGLYDKLRVHQTEARDYRKLRDSLTDETKELSQKINVFKEKRDKLNKAVSELKSSKKKFVVDIRRLSKGIADSKKIRDDLNESARSTEDLIERVLEDKFNVLVSEEVPLRDEIRLFDLVLNLSERLEAARDASEMHKKILEDFKNIKGLSSSIDSLGDQLSVLSKIADEYHKKVVDTYVDIKKKKEEASEAHKKLMEKYKEMDSIRPQINSIKEEMNRLSEEITPINEALEEIRIQREEKKKFEMVKEAREKLKTSKLVSIHDLKMILDHCGIDIKET